MIEINKIYNDDCMNILKQLPDKSIDLVLTDIPYGAVNRKDNGLRSLDKGVADIFTLDLETMLNETIRVCKGSFYMFCGQEQISSIFQKLNENDFSTRLIIWEKTNPSPMNGEYIWLSGIEPCVYGKRKGAVFNGNCLNTVLRIPTAKNEGGEFHTTPKPLKLFERLINISSNENDLVLDCFSGSGTTTVACHKMKRNFICVEKDKTYYELSCKRLEQEQKQLELF